jgi:hypothetical protein
MAEHIMAGIMLGFATELSANVKMLIFGQRYLGNFQWQDI